MAKRPITRKAFIYLRISKDRETEASIAVQLAFCIAYCEARGWEVVGTYTDRGRSAYKGTPRPELDRMLNDVESGLGNVVVVYKLDRLARSVRHFTEMFDRLKAHDCEFVSATESFDTTTPMGRAMLQIAAIFAELESAVKGERLTDWHDHRKGLGVAPTGPRAFGYDKGHVVNPVEAKLIRTAMEHVAAGDTVRSIVNDWTRAGVLTATGGKPTVRGIRHILTSPHTAGLRDIDDVLVDGKWEPILTRDEHEQMCAILNDPTRRLSSTNQPLWLLPGIARCSLCLTPMGSASCKTGHRYSCRSRRGHVGCGRVSIDSARADEAVIRGVLEALDLERVAGQVGRQRGTVNEQLDELEAELVELARRRFGKDGLRAQEWEILRAGIEEQIAAVHAEATSGKVGAAVLELANATDAYDQFCRYPLELQRAILRSVIDFADIAPARAGQYQFENGRIILQWKK